LKESTKPPALPLQSGRLGSLMAAVVVVVLTEGSLLSDYHTVQQCLCVLWLTHGAVDAWIAMLENNGTVGQGACCSY